MDNNRKIARWAGWERDNGSWYSIPGIGRKTQPPLIDELRHLWDNVLFPLIKARGSQDEFINYLSFNVGIDMTMTAARVRWLILRATLAQLIEALVKVIDGEEDAQTTN